MMAGVVVLGPVFEADLSAEQHAYREGRNALSAVEEVRELLNTGHREVVDADLSGYFDGIPHVELLKSVARRVVDRRLLHLLKMWLEAPVEETDKRGLKIRTTINRDSQRGIPQGSPISPLMANYGEYLHAPLYPGVEATRAGGQARCKDRQLCG